MPQTDMALVAREATAIFTIFTSLLSVVDPFVCLSHTTCTRLLRKQARNASQNGQCRARHPAPLRQEKFVHSQAKKTTTDRATWHAAYPEGIPRTPAQPCVCRQSVADLVHGSGTSIRRTKGERVHGARTVRAVWGNYPAFTPQLAPHRTAAHSNIGTQKTSNHMSFLQSKVNLVYTEQK